MGSKERAQFFCHGNFIPAGFLNSIDFNRPKCFEIGSSSASAVTVAFKSLQSPR